MSRSRKLSDFASSYDSGSPFGMKNRIINGGMVIDQRNAGASVTPINQQYSVDRWLCFVSAASKYTVQQNAGSVTPPVGFTNYLGITSSSAYSVGAGEVFGIEQRIEGANTSDLAWGTANAKPVTLSFQVYSSLTGTFGGVIRNNVNNRSYPFAYTVSSANTWTSIAVTIPGDTSGTWVTDSTGAGIKVTFSIGTGSTYSGTADAWAGSEFYSATGATSVVGTSGATFYITGVQLEAGSVASPFERRDYGRELIMCQRYYYNSGSGAALQFGAQGSTTAVEYMYTHPVFMRASPTLSYTSIGNFTAYVFNAAAGKTLVAASINYATTKKALVQASWSGSSGTAGATCSCDAANGDFFAFSAEL